MALTGHCCEHYGDCTSGICIGGACWPSKNFELEEIEHMQKTQLIVFGVVAALLLICLISFCCMKNLKSTIRFKYLPRSLNDNKSSKKYED